ncbi:MAG: fatty acyl-AMP ligase [Sandaracinaceae bacterium]|nr:fatty acyl-AMP ligase [Sandaracinaceae bacterium]
MSGPKTLVEALELLPSGDARGVRFLGADKVERYYPYDAMRAEALKRAAFFAAAGCKKGDRIALILPENHEFVLAFLGASAGGFVPVPLYPGATFKTQDSYLDHVGHILEAAGARAVLCMDQNADVAARLKERPALKDLVVLSAPRAFDGPIPSFTPPSVGPHDLCFLQFTSGSTSRPKGVMVTHANLVANSTAFLGPSGLDRTPEDVGVSWLPLFHDMGLIGFVLGTLVVDLPVVLLPTATFARMPRVWLESITKYRGTITYAPNFAYQLVSKRVRESDLAALELRSLRVAGCGAEPIRAQTLREFAEKFAPAGFDSRALLPSYGMAESCLAITFHPLGTEMVVDRVDPEKMRVGIAEPSDAPNAIEVVSCGIPFPGHELAIVDERGERLGERRVGEILSRGPSVMPGYFQNEEATKESLRDGWLHSGDLGYVAGGTLYICGRIKDLIIIRGANHYPQDLEWAVGELEGVRRGNVCAFSVLRDGEEQLVILAEANRADAARLRREIAQTIYSQFGLQPFDVLIAPVGTLPKTSSGKHQRRRTKALYESGELVAMAHEASADGSSGDASD